MSFSLWPRDSDSSAAESPAFSGDGGRYDPFLDQFDAKKPPPPTPILDFMFALRSSELEISTYRSLRMDDILDTSMPVGSGGQAVVELTRRPGVVIKRTRRPRNFDSEPSSQLDSDLARLTVELRILTTADARKERCFVKAMGVCFDDSLTGLDPLGAVRFHLLLEYSELGDMANFLRKNGQHLATKMKLNLSYQISYALFFLHGLDVCHGDFKLQNVLVFEGKNGGFVAKLSDFGQSAHLYRFKAAERDMSYPPGTPLLSAPEIRNRSLTDAPIDMAALMKADVFSLGLSIWEILKDGRCYFDLAWMSTSETSNPQFSNEEQVAFLSTLPSNGLLVHSEEFLIAQDLDANTYAQVLQIFRASLQDDPLQRSTSSTLTALCMPPTAQSRSLLEQAQKWDAVHAALSHTSGFETWFRSWTQIDFLDYTCLGLPDILQRRALSELELSAKSPSLPASLRERTMVDIATCHLIMFGTEYNPGEVISWLKRAKLLAKSHRTYCGFSLRRISEGFSVSNHPFLRPGDRPKTISAASSVELSTDSELYLTRKLQSRVASAVAEIRIMQSQPEFAFRLETWAMGPIWEKFGYNMLHDMATWDLAALLGDDEKIASLLPAPEAFRIHRYGTNGLHYACLGANVSTLRCLLDCGADPTLAGKSNITALHLLIFVPAGLVNEAIDLLIRRGAFSDVCSEEIILEPTGLKLHGTPVEWATIARNRAMVAALLPYSRGQEKSLLRLAISHAYYEIMSDLLSDNTLSDLFSQQDCPTLIFCHPLFAHLRVHGQNIDTAIERTVRLCDEYDFIEFRTMLRRSMTCARTRECLKALEVLVNLCPVSTIREGLGSDDGTMDLESIVYTAFAIAKSNELWRPVLEAMLRRFTVAELNQTRQLLGFEPLSAVNTLYVSITYGWTIAVRILFEKGVDVHPKDLPHGLSIDLVAQAFADKGMQATLSEYLGGSRSLYQGGTATDLFAAQFVLQNERRRHGRGLILDSPDDSEASTPAILSTVHSILHHLLANRDAIFATQRDGSRPWVKIAASLFEEFQALIAQESISRYINTPAKDKVIMIQRAACYLDVEIIRLLLEAGADANIPFLARRVARDGSFEPTTTSFLPFQIVLWAPLIRLSTCEHSLQESMAKRNATPTRQALIEQQDVFERQLLVGKTEKPHAVHRAVHAISHAVGTGKFRQRKDLKGDQPLSPEAKLAEVVRAKALKAAQELLRWHVLRNDTRFEGITEFHLCFLLQHKTRCLTIIRENPQAYEKKASWPGAEGRYTAKELSDLRFNDELFLNQAYFNNLLKFPMTW